MASSLARAARRLGQGSLRGLSDALSDAGAVGSSGRQAAGRQPWVLRPLGTQAGGSGGEPPAAGPKPEVALEEGSQASTSGSAAAGTAAVPRQRPPPGHTDFQDRQLLMVFTCTKCNTRAAKAFSKQSYERGVVIVECPGCQSKHLIADHLGWFGQKGTVEEFAAERGQMVVSKLADGTVELTPEDLLGRSLVEEAEALKAAAASGSGGGGGGSGSGSGGS